MCWLLPLPPHAQAKGALCVGVTNTVGSAISNATHCGVHLNAGFEIGVASTKVGARARPGHALTETPCMWGLPHHVNAPAPTCPLSFCSDAAGPSKRPAAFPTSSHLAPPRPLSPHPQAYTSQIVALTMMALLLGADSRAKSPKRIAAMRALAELPDAVREALKLDGEMQVLAEQLKDAQSLIFFGRGYNYSTALEAAL